MSFDLNLIRSAVTVLSLLAFAGICVWAWGRARRQRFDEAATYVATTTAAVSAMTRHLEAITALARDALAP